MRIAMIGLGNLGLPVALAIESKGHEVTAWDVRDERLDVLTTRKLPAKEVGAQELLDKTKITLQTPASMMRDREIIFVSVQTPHDPEFEGVTPLPSERKDFDYSYLKAALEKLVGYHYYPAFGHHQASPPVVVVISTCLPGTFKRELEPIVKGKLRYVYSPLYVAMANHSWNEYFSVMPDPADAQLNQLARDKGWDTKFLKGVTVNHQRDSDQALEQHRKL